MLPQQPLCPHLFVISRRSGFSFWRPVHSHFDQTCRSARLPIQSPWRHPLDLVFFAIDSCVFRSRPFYFFNSYSCSFTEPPFLSSPLSLPFVLSLRFCANTALAGVLSSRFNLVLSKLYQMAPAVFGTVYSLLVLIILPQVLAGPSCSHNYHGKPGYKDCRNHGGSGGYNISAFAFLTCQGNS